MPSRGAVEFLSAKTFFQFCSEQAHRFSEQLILHNIERLFSSDKVHSVGD